jgi:hypothetical protein
MLGLILGMVLRLVLHFMHSCVRSMDDADFWCARMIKDDRVREHQEKSIFSFKDISDRLG